MPTRVLLVHGMGRTPLSLVVLAARLRARGFAVSTFGYSVTLQSFDGMLARLVRRIESVDAPFALAGHSLGCVLIRAALPRLTRAPEACFFLAPPSRVPRAARLFSRLRLYRALTGDSGARIMSEAFMNGLPQPSVPTRVYAGVGGPTGDALPFGHEPNDGVLAVSETRIGDGEVIEVPSLHTFIMNSRFVADDIAATLGAHGR